MLKTIHIKLGIYTLEAEANLILGQILMQYVQDRNSSNQSDSILTKKEFEKIREIALVIRNHPGAAYTISKLSVETGLNPYKLQEGFKKLYKTTVIDYIREVRLARAAELLSS